MCVILYFIIRGIEVYKNKIRNVLCETGMCLKCFHIYHTDFHLLSLCQLWCEGSKYYVQGVVGDSEGNYQCLLLGSKRNTREQGILILPVLK